MTWVGPTGAVETRNVLSPSPSSNAVCGRCGFIATDGGGGQRQLRRGGEGTSRTAYDSEQPVGCVADGESEW